MVKLKKKTLLIIVLICILFITFIFCTIFSIIKLNSSKIIKGISINGIDVSNMTKAEAVSKISKLVEDKLISNIKIYYDEDTKDVETNIEVSTLEVEYDINSAINEAYNMGRIGNIFQNNFTILDVLINKKNIELNISLNEEIYEKIITNVSSNIPEKLVQSSYYIEDDKLIITKGTKGNFIIKEKFKEELYNILQKIDGSQAYILIPFEYTEPEPINIDNIYNEIYKEPQDAYYEENPFKVYKEVQGIDFDKVKAQKLITEKPDNNEYEIKLNYTKAKTKLEDLEIDIFQDLLGSFSTRYDERNKDRTNNLNLAARKIDGIVLSPGEEFSYNKIVGERTIEAGYKESKIYSNGQVVDGLGGGICQISSTLYNAVMFANLDVTERHNHHFVTSYVDSGRDATVAYGSKDFKFVNNRTYPIKIKISVNSGIAKVEIYGIKEETEYNISFEVETISTIDFTTKYEYDSSLEIGQEKVKQKGAKGLVVKVYKVAKQNGIIISKDVISQDTYSALNKIIIKGE